MFDPNRICLGCMEELKNGDAVCPKCGWNNAVNNNVSHQLLAGSVLMGKYLVGRVLGEGGFGITYIGWDLILDRKVAIKEFYPQGIVNRELTHHSTVVSCIGKEEFIEKEKEGFIKEAKTMAKLGNIPGIVTMHDVFAQNGTVYIVMDYVEGKTLKAYVKENGNRLSAKTAISLLEPIFGALQKIHEKGLIHRDISPDNIMLRPDGTAVLLDFGAARQMSVAGERSLTVNLKHGYAPMEQYQTRGVQGPWTDVYALSATIYRLITGRVPPSAADRIIEDDLPLPSTLGSDILPRQEEALMKGLAIRTADRTLNISELWEGLSQAPAEKAPQKQPQEEPAEENKTDEPQHIPAQQQTEESHTGEELPIEHRAEQTEPPKEPSAEERQEPEENKQPKKKKSEGIKFLAAVLALLLLCVLIFEPSIDILDIKKEINYRKGVSSFENKEYDKAYEQLSAVKGYKDAEEMVQSSDDAMMEYVNGHQVADDYLTYQYLDLLHTHNEQANEIYYKLYGKFMNLGSDENTLWTSTQNGTLTIGGVGKLSYIFLTQSERDATKNIVIKEGITELGSLSFHGFDKVKSIKIPSTVKYISDDAFDESVISKIKIDKNNKYYTVENGKLVRIND